MKQPTVRRRPPAHIAKLLRSRFAKHDPVVACASAPESALVAATDAAQAGKPLRHAGLGAFMESPRPGTNRAERRTHARNARRALRRVG